MNHNLDFLFLSEADAVKAGAGDIHTCIQVMDEVFDLLGQGDYLMGAPNHNSHGIKIYFPKETPFPGMPVKGPDRRFMALVGYLAEDSMYAVKNGMVLILPTGKRACRVLF